MEQLTIFGPCPLIETIETHVTIGTIAGRIVEADPDTLALLISNNGTGIITLSTDNQVTVDQGHVIPNGGQPFLLTWRDHFTMVTRAYYAIAAVASTPVTITRIKRV